MRSKKKTLRLIRIRDILVDDYQSAAVPVSVGMIARARGLNEPYPVDLCGEGVYMVMPEEGGDDVARFLPAFKFFAVFERRAGGLAEHAVEQSAVREFYSGAYYDLFLVMRGSGVFRCSEVVLPAQQQNLIIFKPGQGGRLEYAGAYGPLELIRVQLPPQTLAQLSDADTDLEKSFNVVPFRQVAVRPDSQIYMLLKNLARKLLMLPQERTQFGAAVFEHGILQMFVVLALRACIHAEFHTASVSRHHLMLDEVFLFIQAHLTEELTLERLEKEFFVSREHIAREFKRQTGQTVHRYIVKARLDRCCTLIEQGLPITEVYKTSGFGGYNHFFRAFKKEYGMTPKEYFSTTRQDARG